MKVYIGLGANLGNREANIRKAIAALSETLGTDYVVSDLMASEPMGFASENRFLNAVAIFRTAHVQSAEALVALFKDIEKRMGRRLRKDATGYADRPIDIDLLFLDATVHDNPLARVPHPHITERRFVLEPLCSLEPSLLHPVTHKTVLEHLRELNTLEIAKAETPDRHLEELVNRLVPQLSPGARRLTHEDLELQLANPASALYVGYDETKHGAGMFTLSTFRLVTGLKMWLDDVVVDEHCRGRGYGRQMVAFAQAEARRAGASALYLTSRPEREAANRLYRTMGFNRRNTNVYVWPIPEPDAP